MSVKKQRRIFSATTIRTRSVLIVSILGSRGFLTIFFSILMVPLCAYCQVNLTPTPGVVAQLPGALQSGERLVGTVRVQNGRIVTLVTAAKIYRIEGLIVPYLLKEDGKQWRLEGRLTDELTLDAMYAVPLQSRKS